MARRCKPTTRKPPSDDWQGSYVSTYAAAHPWEDFAETWAHYLHIIDTLETARAFRVRVDPDAASGDELTAEVDFDVYRVPGIEPIIEAWLPLSFAVNSLNRSMGQPDLYPFVLSAARHREARLHAPAAARQPAPRATSAAAGGALYRHASRAATVSGYCGPGPHSKDPTDAKFNPRQTGPAQAARPSAAEAKAENERYQTFQSRMARICRAASKAGREELANQLVDLSQRVEDREITLDEGLDELRDHEVELRAMLKR